MKRFILTQTRNNGGAGGVAPDGKFLPPWKSVLDIV